MPVRASALPSARRRSAAADSARASSAATVMKALTLRVGRLDAAQKGLGQLRRSHLTPPQQVLHFMNGQVRQFHEFSRKISRFPTGPQALSLPSWTLDSVILFYNFRHLKQPAPASGALPSAASAPREGFTTSSRKAFSIGTAWAVGMIPSVFEFVELVDIAEDGIHLARQRFQLVLLQGQPGQPGDMFDFGAGNFHCGFSIKRIVQIGFRIAPLFHPGFSGERKGRLP